MTVSGRDITKPEIVVRIGNDELHYTGSDMTDVFATAIDNLHKKRLI